MDNVTFQRQEYIDAVPVWKVVSDVVAGQRKVKAAETEYLFKPNPLDASNENAGRYKQYLARAVFVNYTGRTLVGLLGAAYRKAPSINVPTALDYVLKDVDGKGNSINQQSQQTTKCVTAIGRHGLLVDLPKSEGAISKLDVDKGLHRPKIVKVKAEDITHWDFEKVGAEMRLSLVTISETYVERGKFSRKEIQQFRVLRLVEGIYHVEIWRKPADNGDFELVETYMPLDGYGKAWAEIPFTFVGSENNDAEIDPAPLLDLAELNLAHYRNSADYEDSAFICGQPQPWISGLDQNWRDHLEKAGIYLGSRAPMLLPEKGAFGIAQAKPNSQAREAMQDKEKAMVALGARIVQSGGAVKTATEAQDNSEAEHSTLSLIVENVSEAYTKCLVWMARFAKASEDNISYELSSEFAESSLDAQMLTALIAMWQSGKYPSTDLWDQLRKYGLIDPEKDDEEIREELDSESDGLDLGDEGGERPNKKLQTLIDEA